jgi:hypothetical protein
MGTPVPPGSWLAGARLEFLGGRTPPAFHLPSFRVTDDQRRWWLSMEEPRLMALGVISQVDASQAVEHVDQRLLCSYAAGSGSWRIVVSFKHMNTAQKAYKEVSVRVSPYVAARRDP